MIVNKGVDINQAIKDNERLVDKFISQSKYDKVEDREEFKQVCMIGLWRALEKYDESRGVKFGYYAYIYMQSEATRYFRNNHWLGGYRACTSSPKPLYGEDENIVSKSDKGDRTCEKSCIFDTLKDEKDYIEDFINNQGDKELVKDLIEALILSIKEEQIIDLYYFKNKTTLEISKILKCSKETIYSILKRVPLEMKEVLEYWGEVAM